MEHKKVPVSDLRIGMYVANLDRPWLDSPFLFRALPSRDEQELTSSARPVSTSSWTQKKW